ncbi:hypothetical protein OG949_41255 (plasmid) [Streptomyces scopuliridis]|uniref:hypothetical protein n=1 Tax=Streptomyces scopuliridis TaxID=452529 RepID=UPI002DD9FF39|nr:hypothetical protein [Streptomyces scopuliridis]WSB39171.1 hypothetical protein OG949_41255 [Streptomyces scopuliridis]
MLFAALLIRRPRRLRHLRRLASTAPTAPLTVIRLPGRLRPAPQAGGPFALPGGFRPVRPATPQTTPAAATAAEELDQELQVRAWLHLDQHGRTDTALPAPGVLAEAEERRAAAIPHSASSVGRR